jgi:hypothetical protein
MPGNLDIEFPRLGVVRRVGYSQTGSKGGFGTPWAYNVRLEDVLTKRLRGGSFTGRAYVFNDQVAPNIVSDDFYAYQHLFTVGDAIQFTTDGVLPVGLSLDTTYYVISTETNRFAVSTTPGGSSVDMLGVGTGPHYASSVWNKESPIYRDRQITFGDSETPNSILASRQGDPTDTELSADVSDVARPVLFQLCEAGAVGGAVVAVAAHKDAFLVCFTATETWVLQGDPAQGSLRRVSNEVGIVGAYAWCFARDTIYWLSSHGLYRMQADGSGFQAISEDRTPVELTGVSDADCNLTYYHADRGVYINLTSAPSWFYDTEREGLWPFDTSETDSHLLVGPIKLNDIDRFGLIQELHGMLAEGSATVNWRIVPGTTAQEAAANGKLAIAADLGGGSYSSYIQGSGTWTAGRSYTERPRTRAMWACIWLSSAGTWAWERMTMSLIPAGNWRG